MTVVEKVLEFDTGTVLVGDLLDNGQAQASALGLGGDVGLEGTLEDVLGKAAPAVFHDQPDAVGGLVPLGAQHHLVWACASRYRIGCILRVLQQVVDHLPQLHRVA